MTHKERILLALRGEMPDLIPYTPRIDLWYNANRAAGTLPPRHIDRTQDEISRAEGWALHKISPDFLHVRRPEDTIHRGLGVYALKEMVFEYQFSHDIGIEIEANGEKTRITYHTPLGSISTATIFTEEMRKAGTSLAWIDEHAIKGPSDYKVLGYIFENLTLISAYDDYLRWSNDVGNDGVAVAMAGLAASPMHHIQREFLDATAFYFHYNDYPREMLRLKESLENFYEQALKIVADGPADVILWGANFDDMITYPSYFEKEFLPWLRRVSEVLENRGKLLLSHCDGENFGLMDLIASAGIHVAEAICPFPMTKVKLEEYYRRWSRKLTIWGGIPSNLLLAESATDAEFESYLDEVFKSVAPGSRFILSIADCVPPHAVFDRLQRIADRVLQEGQLPLRTMKAQPLRQVYVNKQDGLQKLPEDQDEKLHKIQKDVMAGRVEEIKDDIGALLDLGYDPLIILRAGMLAAMEVIGRKFRSGDVFIPEVLLAARAMNEGVLFLEPYLGPDRKDANGKILIGTVHGDFHDIGKNIVITMLRGVGFDVTDLGISVPTESFVKMVEETKPDILGLSALLTTTMPEMRKVIHALEKSGCRDKLKIIIGGAPVNAKFAQDIGADGYAPNAGDAVTLAKSLMGG